jgi:hypothetical protein
MTPRELAAVLNGLAPARERLPRTGLAELMDRYPDEGRTTHG